MIDVEQEVCSFDSLFNAMMECKKGVMWKDSVARYVNNGLVSILKLYNSLQDGSYEIDDYFKFTIHEPKKREILSNRFKDRVFQRSLVVGYLYDAITKGFIHDNCACQIGKGTDFARNRLKCHMQRFFRKHGMQGWVVKCDIKSYFDSTDHSETLSCISRYVEDAWAFTHVESIVRSYATKENPDKGIGLGSQVNQLTQLLFLSDMDHFIKERLEIKAYCRYMDDFVLIHHDKEHLRYCLEEIRKFLANKKLRLNEKKTQLFPLGQGINFLGFKFKLTETCKVLMLLDKSNVKRQKRKLRKYRKLVYERRMTRSKADECYQSWREHASKGNSYWLLRRMDAYYENLWEE